MSTRSHIVVINNSKINEKHYVYHHHDGYIEGVGEELKKFISSNYKPSTFSADEFCEQLENWESSYEYEDYGIHGDEEYIYHVNIESSEEKKVTVSVEELHVSRDKNDKWQTEWKNIEEYTETFKLE